MRLVLPMDGYKGVFEILVFVIAAACCPGDCLQ